MIQTILHTIVAALVWGDCKFVKFPLSELLQINQQMQYFPARQES